MSAADTENTNVVTPSLGAPTNVGVVSIAVVPTEIIVALFTFVKCPSPGARDIETALEETVPSKSFLIVYSVVLVEPLNNVCTALYGNLNTIVLLPTSILVGAEPEISAIKSIPLDAF